MKIVQAGFEVFDPIDGSNTLKKIESCRRDRKATSSDVRGYGSIAGGSKETDPGSI